MEVRGLYKWLPGGWVLRGVDLTVEGGEAVLITGPNGSGKTTLLRVIAGLLHPSRGVVRVCGSEPTSAEARRCLGFAPDRPLLYSELTVGENLRFYSALYSTGGPPEWVVRSLGLSRYWGRRVGELSYGWRRRADLARALVHSPKLLLVDEPFVGLDEEASRALAGIISRLVSSGGAVVAASPTVDGWVEWSRVLRFEDGRLVEVRGA